MNSNHAQEFQGVLKRDTVLVHGTCSGHEIMHPALIKSGGWTIHFLVVCLQDQGIAEVSVSHPVRHWLDHLKVSAVALPSHTLVVHCFTWQ